MVTELKYAIIFIILSSVVQIRTQNDQSVSEAFVSSKLVPDVIGVAPTALLNVVYFGGVTVNLGNKLFPLQVVIPPLVSYDALPDQYYLLAMIDPDVPFAPLPILGEFDHWLVGNIPGNNVTAGDVLAPYFPPTPPPGPPHRYTFLVFLQPGKLDYTKSLLTSISILVRVKFCIARFAAEYNLGNPIAGNFFRGSFL